IQSLRILRQEAEVAFFRLDGDHQCSGESECEEDGADSDMRASVDNKRTTTSPVLCFEKSADLRPSSQTSHAEGVFFKDIANDLSVRRARPETEGAADSRGFNGHLTEELLHEGEAIQPFQHDAVWIPLAHDHPPEPTFQATEKCGFKQISRGHLCAAHKTIGGVRPDVSHGGSSFSSADSNVGTALATCASVAIALRGLSPTRFKWNGRATL